MSAPEPLARTKTVLELFLDACNGGDLELVRNLLRSGADVNWQDEDDELQAGLHYATLYEHEDVIDLLLAQPGVEVNIRDDFNNTPLMFACYASSVIILEKLLQAKGIDINCRNGNGSTPLLFCLKESREEGNIELAKILLRDPRVDLNVQNLVGKFPEDIAR